MYFTGWIQETSSRTQGSFRFSTRREASTSVALGHTMTLRQGVLQGACMRLLTPSASGVRCVVKTKFLSSRSRLVVG